MDLKIPNIRHLRAFCEVFYTKRISDASKNIHLSQSAVTQALAKIENTFNLRLFDRRPDGMFITEPGLLFLKRVERGLLHIKNGASDAVRVTTKKDIIINRNFYRLLTSAQIKSLIAVSEAQNFSLAARRIGVSQPTLHRSARELEKLSGIPLFIKKDTGIELSRAALLLVKHIKLAVSELKQGIMEIDNWHKRDAGKITIGCLPIAKTNLIPETICKFSESYPDIKIAIVDGNYDELLCNLRNGDIDFFISPIKKPLQLTDIRQEFLFNDKIALVVRAEHPILKQLDPDLNELLKYPWIVAPEKAPVRNYFNEMFERAGLKIPHRLVESNSLIIMRSLLQQSDRIALLPKHIINFEEQFNLLVYLPFNLPESKRSIGVTLRKNWRPTSTQSVFLNILKRIKT